MIELFILNNFASTLPLIATAVNQFVFLNIGDYLKNLNLGKTMAGQLSGL